MSEIIRIKKGFDIKLQGSAEINLKEIPVSKHYAIKPDDFIGIKPKISIQEGDNVKAGTVLFSDKDNPQILFCSPVSGKIAHIDRGERRSLLSIVIETSGVLEYEGFDTKNWENMNSGQIAEIMQKAGAWPYIKQRPYNIIARPGIQPKAVFVSAFDTAPLAPDYDFVLRGRKKQFQAGIKVLNILSNLKIQLGINANRLLNEVFTDLEGVELHRFSGPHPAGNAGIQIHHVSPVNKGEIVWVINPQDVATIGNLFLTGIHDASKIIALTGSQIIKPQYYKTINGVQVSEILKDNMVGLENRIISGNVLTGKKISPEGYIGFYDNQLTIIPEGHQREFLGWALPGLDKLSLSKSYFSWLWPQKKYKVNTNLNGEDRAYVMSGQYEKLLPMDILPVHLIKAILAEDIDLMEQLGIYEVVEEDFALCEFACTSKINVQEILRKGLDLVRKEMN